MNQRPDKLDKYAITYKDWKAQKDAGNEVYREFKSTYDVLVLTTNPLNIPKEESVFNITSYIIDVANPPVEKFKYSLYITISIGLPLMIFTLCFFEGRNIIDWFKLKIKSCGSSDKVRHTAQEGDAHGPGRSNKHNDLDASYDQYQNDIDHDMDNGQIELIQNPGGRSR